VSRSFGCNQFTIAGFKCYSSIFQPNHVKQRIGWSTKENKSWYWLGTSNTFHMIEKPKRKFFFLLFLWTGLNSTGSFQSPIFVLHGSYIPAFRTRLEFQLECLIVRDFILVCCHVHSYNHVKSKIYRINLVCSLYSKNTLWVSRKIILRRLGEYNI